MVNYIVIGILGNIIVVGGYICINTILKQKSQIDTMDKVIHKMNKDIMEKSHSLEELEKELEEDGKLPQYKEAFKLVDNFLKGEGELNGLSTKQVSK